MPEQTAKTNGKLVSWKEIAAYLRCDIRTVQRWEQELGLPVHRPPGGKGHRVFALPAEIDAWLTRHDHDGVGWRRDRDGDEGAGSWTSPAASLGTPAPAVPGGVSSGIPATLPAARPAAVADSTPAVIPPTESTSPARRNRVVGWVTTGIVLAAIAGAAFWWEGGDVEIGGVTVAGRQVLAWSNGKVAWSHDFGRPLRPEGSEDAMPEVQIQDLNGDGSKEIIVAAPLLVFDGGDASTDALYCFSSRGKVLWRQVFDNHVHFGGEDCGPRWQIQTLMVTSQSGKRSVWCTICSYPTSVAVLVKIDPSGHATPYFVNYGHLNALNEVHASSGSYVLAGGVNNEYNCAMLAVLAESGVSGRSPQTGAFSDCDSCPGGEPYRYLLFPRSDVSAAAGKPYNSVFNVLVTGPRAQAMTVEIPGAGAPEPADWGLYELADDFTPRTRFFSDNYWADHQRFSAEGKIKHDVEHCPERVKPVKVRVWSAENGWRDVLLPPIAGQANQAKP
ncbi:MAG TPA: hypothetical protein VKU44_07265 [Terriglobia bacterium]|nr:hypothetical protein [Terriglobia bacterium]